MGGTSDGYGLLAVPSHLLEMQSEASQRVEEAGANRAFGDAELGRKLRARPTSVVHLDQHLAVTGRESSHGLLYLPRVQRHSVNRGVVASAGPPRPHESRRHGLFSQASVAPGQARPAEQQPTASGEIGLQGGSIGRFDAGWGGAEERRRSGAVPACRQGRHRHPCNTKNYVSLHGYPKPAASITQGGVMYLSEVASDPG